MRLVLTMMAFGACGVASIGAYAGEIDDDNIIIVDVKPRSPETKLLLQSVPAQKSGILQAVSSPSRLGALDPQDPIQPTTNHG